MFMGRARTRARPGPTPCEGPFLRSPRRTANPAPRTDSTPAPRTDDPKGPGPGSANQD